MTSPSTGYDLIVNLGLFYHLTLDDQLFLLDRAAGTPMILDTHVATNKPQGVGPLRAGQSAGYSGRLYSEANKQHHRPHRGETPTRSGRRRRRCAGCSMNAAGTSTP